MTTGDTRDWTHPQAEQVAPRVYRLPLPLPGDGLRAVNVYALMDDERVTLVDGGWAISSARDALDVALRTLGAELGAVTDVLVTHAHRDHYTLAVTVRREFGCRISLGAAERVSAESLSRRGPQDEVKLASVLRTAGAHDLAEKFFGRPTAHDRTDWERPDRWLDDGTVLEAGGRALRVVHTPGHTRGHVVFADDAAGLLFAGDHVLSTITPSLGFEEVPPASPLADFLTSLALLKQRPDARVLPGHGPVTGSVHARVDELLAHHEHRLQASLDAVVAGDSTAGEVARRLLWTRRHRRYAELDDFNRMLATIETHAHLVVLADRGLLDRDVQRDGVLAYRRSVLPAAAVGPSGARRYGQIARRPTTQLRLTEPDDSATP